VHGFAVGLIPSSLSMESKDSVSLNDTIVDMLIILAGAVSCFTLEVFTSRVGFSLYVYFYSGERSIYSNPRK
jgi:hypothetical protein